jgi:hypothetical protein
METATVSIMPDRGQISSFGPFADPMAQTAQPGWVIGVEGDDAGVEWQLAMDSPAIASCISSPFQSMTEDHSRPNEGSPADGDTPSAQELNINKRPYFFVELLSINR